MPPRPRPQPRPRAKPVSDAPSASEVSSPEARRKRTKQDEDEEDAMFMRNRGPGRSLREVNKRAERAAALASQTSSSPAGSDEEEDEEDTPKQGLNKKRKQNALHGGKSNALPKWAKKGAIQTLLNSDSDSESENNYPSVSDGSPSKRRRTGTSGSNAGTPRGGRERRRSRSRSLTPPPGPTQAQKLSTQQVLMSILGEDDEDDVRTTSRDAEIEDDGDDTGETILDPELERIIRERASKQNTGGSTQRDSSGTSRHGLGSGPATVDVRVKWVPHPDDDEMISRPQATWSFTVKRHHSLKELFQQVSEKALVILQDLVLMHNGNSVLTGVSPQGLHAWNHLDLEACDRTTYEAIRTRHFRSPTPAPNNVNFEELVTERGASAAPSDASDEPGDADKFKLVLRAHDHKNVTLTVRPTTSCGKIVRAFIATIAKHGGKAPASPRKVRLCIDGEKQDPETPIADCDLEDGDMVEVVGL